MSAKGRANVARIEDKRQEKAAVKLHSVLSFLSVARVAESFGKVELHLTDGRVINLGTYKNALNFRDAQAAIAAVTHKAINLKKGTKWEHVAQTVFDAVEVQEGFSYTEDDEARGWLEAYCKRRLLRSAVDMSNAEELFEALEKYYKGFRSTQGDAYVSLERLHALRRERLPHATDVARGRRAARPFEAEEQTDRRAPWRRATA